MKRGKKHHQLIAVGEILVSEELNAEFFACDLMACKGACCVEGDIGAPLEKQERQKLEASYPAVEPKLPEAGKDAIRRQGFHVRDITGGISTPLVNGRECAYTVFAPNGVAQCGIELAWKEGKIPFRKPVSCQLYPIRINRTRHHEALYYDRWDICAPACKKGDSLGIRVYEFVKEALIRKYGQAFYDELDAVMKAIREDEEKE